MKNKELRKIAKENMKGKFGKALGISVVYFIINFLITFLLGYIPIIGSLVASVINVPLAFGWTKHIIMLMNGENVGLIDFLRHGFGNFGRVWCSSLWISLKVLLWVLGMALGGILMIFVNEALGAVVVAAASLGMIIKTCKYCMINYTLVYDQTNSRARDLVNRTATEAKGNIWKFLCMGMYYAGTMFAVIFLISFIMAFLGAAVPSLALIIMIVCYIVMILAIQYYGIQNIAACNELYKNNVLGGSVYNGNNYTSGDGFDQNSEYNLNPNMDMSPNNYGYNSDSAIDMNNNGQSNDYFSNY